MPIVDDLLASFRKKPDPNEPPITGKMRRSDGLDSPPPEVEAVLGKMRPPKEATNEHLAGLRPPSVEEFSHPERGNDFSMLGVTNQNIAMPRGGMGPPMQQAAPMRGADRMDLLEQKIDILTDKVDIVQQQVKMIWDTLKSWRTR